MFNSVKHVGATKKSRIIGEVASEGGRIWRDYCITIVIVYFFTEVNFHFSFYFYQDFSISGLFTLFFHLQLII